MPQFSESEINDAKRRVREMKNRAGSFVNDNARQAADVHHHEEEQPENERNQNHSEEEISKENGDSSFIILALLMLLSREGADNKLLFALLYLLL